MQGIHRPYRRALGIIALALVGVAGCEAQEEEATTPNAPQPGERERGPQSAAGPLSEEQAAGVVSVINQGEIAQAELALPRLQNAQVRDYAQRMIAEHRESDMMLGMILSGAGLSLEESALGEQTRTLAEHTEANMRTMLTPGLADRGYLDAQIVMHRRALITIDTQLLPAADRPELRAFLETTRSAVQKHLAEANKLRKLFPADVP